MLMNLQTINKEDSIIYLRKKFSRDKIEIPIEAAVYLIERVNLIPYYIQFAAIRGQN